jgi:hypothetical protein
LTTKSDSSLSSKCSRPFNRCAPFQPFKLFEQLARCDIGQHLYMHLKNERAVIYAIVLVPLAFIIIFLFGLFPDFVYQLTKP